MQAIVTRSPLTGIGRSGDLVIGRSRSRHRVIGRSGDRGDLAALASGDRAIWRSGDLAALASGDRVIRRSGDLKCTASDGRILGCPIMLAVVRAIARSPDAA
jgi:hypothetical protein